MKRVVSGIQASGDLTIGNLLGAIKPWVKSQVHQENFFFVPDLHTLTVRQEPKKLNENTLGTAAWFLASGINPAKANLFVQSDIPAHSELSWILSNYTTVGELNRMTQYKDKSQHRGAAGQVVGLFTYPVLMAADILLYDADEVPVGQDQVQHIELTRDIAERFNNIYGQTFKLPNAKLDESGAQIMDLQEPTKKMSKSDPLESLGVVRLFDKPDVIRRKLTKATTDSGAEVKVDAKKEGISNLIKIHSALSDKSTQQVEKDYARKTYAQFKSDTAELAVTVLEPMQREFQRLMSNRDEIIKILRSGADKATLIANKKLTEVKQKLGLLTDKPLSK